MLVFPHYRVWVKLLPLVMIIRFCHTLLVLDSCTYSSLLLKTCCHLYLFIFPSLLCPWASFPLFRRCLRRQSARFKSHERDPENLFEIEDAKISATEALSNPMCNEESTPLHASSVKEEKEEEIGCASSRSESGVSQRSSIGRPLRRAVEKVQSYKEVPLNVKMRRKNWP